MRHWAEAPRGLKPAPQCSLLATDLTGRLLIAVQDNGVEFLDQPAAALGLIDGVAYFEAEAGHGTKIGIRIALVQVNEQSRANVIDCTDVDPVPGVGQSVDAAPGRGVLPD